VLLRSSTLVGRLRSGGFALHDGGPCFCGRRCLVFEGVHGRGNYCDGIASLRNYTIQLRIGVPGPGVVQDVAGCHQMLAQAVVSVVGKNLIRRVVLHDSHAADIAPRTECMEE
jgi:hypothetical protein